MLGLVPGPSRHSVTTDLSTHDGGSPAEYGAGVKVAIERGWLEMHRSGTYVKFTPARAKLFA